MQKASVNYLLVMLLTVSPLGNAKTSTCYGTTSNGSLSNGVQLPAQGANYVTYSYAAHLAGRTYLHSEVREIVLAAYQVLRTEQPSKVFKYAETGWQSGALLNHIRPIKTACQWIL